MNENGLNYIDLFAGAGGLSEGFIQSGYRPVAHVEMNEHAAKTIETRIAYYYLKDNGKIKSYYDYEKGKITREQLLEKIPKEELKTVINQEMSESTIKGIFNTIDDIKREKEIDKILKDIGLIEFKNSYPNELSGGMRQRINFARALIGSPDIILMDEPFKSLDIKSKHEMINLVMELRKKSIVTIILVTHSIDEIIKLSDIVYLLGGRPVRILETAEGVKIKNIVENLYKSIDEFN